MKQLLFILSLTLSINCIGTIQTPINKDIKYRDSVIVKEYFKFSKSYNIDDKHNIFSYFIGTPYKSGTLEINESEKLVINLRAFDCLTFVENTISLYICLKKKNENIASFSDILKDIRYRDGKVVDYTSRLHYSTDWIYNNYKNNFIEDITGSLGGKEFKVNVSFMSSHPNSYKQLKDVKLIKEITNIEYNINSRKHYFIPKNEVINIEDKLNDGDIVFITTNIKGLDISHVGFAIKVNGKTHLLHASSTYKKVIISENSLHTYLAKIKHHTGIIVCRLK